MRKKTIPAPFELMITIVERGVSAKVSEILRRHDCQFSLITLGEGTARSQVSDIFGFGIVNRDVVWSFVDPLMAGKILKAFDEELELSKPAKGIAMTIPVQAGSNLLLDVLGINY